MDKVLLVIGDAAEATDTLYPYFRVQEAGYACVVAAPEVRAYHLVIHDKHPNWDITVESRGYELASDIAFRDVITADYAALIVSGGRAPEYLRYDRDLMRITQEMTHLGRPVSSTCHGIEILAAAGVLKGRRATTVAKCRYDIESFGGT
ncbi:MAG TPA: DJ-1/PfpI family protein, partial [Limnochordia bacterium]|nr:DJ-1/PfpI family protein [Limnochordia bacterium]